MKPPEVYIRRMYLHASSLKELVDNGEVTPELLGTSRIVQMATVKALELVGENAWQLAKTGFSLGGGIDLASIASMRHRMVHEYEGVDWGVVHDAAFEEIPALVIALDHEMKVLGIETGDAPDEAM